MRSEPVRTCIGCRRTASKREMVKLARRSDGQVVVDRLGREAGRGAYLCPDPGCLEAALKGGTLTRAFRGPARIGSETPAVLALARERLLQNRIEPANASSARE